MVDKKCTNLVIWGQFRLLLNCFGEIEWHCFRQMPLKAHKIFNLKIDPSIVVVVVENFYSTKYTDTIFLYNKITIINGSTLLNRGNLQT